MELLNSSHLIDGVWVASDSGATALSIDPSNGGAVGRFADGGQVEAGAAIAAARRAFDTLDWAQSPRRRQLVMLQWADRLEADAEELAELLTRENGKPLAQSRGEIAGSVSEVRYYAGLCRHHPGHVQEVTPGDISIVTREAAGVAGMIIPWNAPGVLLVRSLAPALAAGCTSVIKPAAQTTLFTARMLAALHGVEGLPAGVVNMVSESGSAVAEALVASADVDVLSFTGSNATGKRIMAVAASTMKKLSLELGGKSCCVVFDDVDVNAVAPKLAAAATIIAGQQCTAARRVLVHASIAARMKQALAGELARINVGPGLEAASQMGPLIDFAARDRIDELCQQTFDSCDEVLLRGRRPEGALANGAFLTPSMVGHEDSGAFFCQDEIFGPLLVVETFETEAEAVKRANHTVYGLSASVWTNDIKRSFRVARALRNGTVWINEHNTLFAEAETGGYRESGIGRLHGFEALADFTESKHIYNAVGTVMDG